MVPPACVAASWRASFSALLRRARGAFAHAHSRTGSQRRGRCGKSTRRACTSAAAQRQPGVGGGRKRRGAQVSHLLLRTLQRAAAHVARVTGQHAVTQRGLRVAVLCVRFSKRWQPRAGAARRRALTPDSDVIGSARSVKPRSGGSAVVLLAGRRAPASGSAAARAQGGVACAPTWVAGWASAASAEAPSALGHAGPLCFRTRPLVRKQVAPPAVTGGAHP